MKISEIREQALKDLLEQEVEFNVDQEFVVAEAKKAVDEILKQVKLRPKTKHLVDVFIGHSLSEKATEAYQIAFKEEIKKLGFRLELSVTRHSFSNVGDPYFMGTNKQRITDYIRISEWN